MIQSFKQYTYRELQKIAKSLQLSAGGKRIQIMGRIRMFYYWKNKNDNLNTKLNVITNYNCVQSMFIKMMYVIWFYLIFQSSKMHNLKNTSYINVLMNSMFNQTTNHLNLRRLT